MKVCFKIQIAHLGKQHIIDLIEWIVPEAEIASPEKIIYHIHISDQFCSSVTDLIIIELINDHKANSFLQLQFGPEGIC